MLEILSKFTRITSLILCLALAVSILGGPAFATDSDEAVGFDSYTFKVKAKQASANTKVYWKAVPDAAYYRVWRSDSADGAKTLLAKKHFDRKYIDKNAESGKRYFYHVRAYDGNGLHTKTMSSKEFQTVYRVYVETGHGIGISGEWEPGARWNGYEEARLMIPIAQATCNYLKKNGIYVYTDAYDNNNRNLLYTLDFLNTHSVSAFLNIHCDAAFEDAGTLPLYKTKKQKAFAKALNKAVHQYVNIANRGLDRRTDLETFNSPKVHCVACLYEVGNIKKDNKKIRKKYNAFGKGLAKGICDYLGQPFQE